MTGARVIAGVVSTDLRFCSCLSLSGPVPLRARAVFPKAARLLKTDEFSSVFRLRPWRRSTHFVVYAKPTGQAGRLGLVVGKKFAPRAATRNLVKRTARESFRLRRAEFEGWDVLLRLSTRIDKAAFPSAVSPPLKALFRTEIEYLLGKVAREIARRGAPLPPPESPPGPQV